MKSGFLKKIVTEYGVIIGPICAGAWFHYNDEFNTDQPRLVEKKERLTKNPGTFFFILTKPL